MTLRLTPFERYMVAEDRATYPMSFEYVLECSGEVDRTLLEKAYHDTITRHPLTWARLRKGVFRSDWTWPETPQTRIVWDASESAGRTSGYRSPDIEAGIGVELLVRLRMGVTRLHFIFHHAVCDGLGALQFINGVLLDYDLRVRESGSQASHNESHEENSDASSSPAEDSDSLDSRLNKLRRRGTFVLPSPVRLTFVQAIVGMTREFCKVVFRRPKAIPADQPDENRSSQDDSVRFVRLPVATTERLGAVARNQNSKLNDLIVRDWFLTLRAWFLDNAPATTSGWLRVLVPTNLRDPSMVDISAANILGYAMVTRRVKECETADELLASITSDMQAVRDWGLGSLFVTALGYVDKVPGLLWLTCRCSRRFSTSLLSNLGNLSRHFDHQLQGTDGRLNAGGLSVERISAIPPVRPGTRVSMVVGRYRGQLDFSVRYDSRWLSDGAIDGLVDRYVRRLETSCAPQEGDYDENRDMHESIEQRRDSRSNGKTPRQQSVEAPRGVSGS